MNSNCFINDLPANTEEHRQSPERGALGFAPSRSISCSCEQSGYGSFPCQLHKGQRSAVRHHSKPQSLAPYRAYIYTGILIVVTVWVFLVHSFLMAPDWTTPFSILKIIGMIVMLALLFKCIPDIAVELDTADYRYDDQESDDETDNAI
ncbi:hypothetical protein BDZ91DRAFT_710797 [Kalaharituber pfeilii]|nr:hypothetical protein BDZ91DRAFT_710797 [Kalaharituber pfeilii]